MAWKKEECSITNETNKKAFFKRVDVTELTKMIENGEKPQNEIIWFINKELTEYHCKQWKKITCYKIKEELESKLINKK